MYITEIFSTENIILMVSLIAFFVVFSLLISRLSRGRKKKKEESEIAKVVKQQKKEAKAAAKASKKAEKLKAKELRSQKNKKNKSKAEKKENKKSKGTSNQQNNRSVNDCIPYENVYENGIIETKPGFFTKSYRVPNMNFKTAKNESQWKTAEAWSQFLSTFDSNIVVQLVLYNKTINISEFQSRVFIDMKADNLNLLRDEYNTMLMEKMTGAKNNLETEKILTIGLPASDIMDAVEKFTAIDGMVTEGMTTMSRYDAPALTTIERLEILNSIYNQDSTVPLYTKRVVQGKEVESFSLENCAAQGITTKEVIGPASMRVYDKYIEMGNTIVKSFYVTNYPTWIKGTILTDFSAIPANMLTSVYFNIIPTEESFKMVKRQGVNISSGLVDAQKKASKAGYDPSLISPDLQKASEEANELMEGMSKDNSRLFTVTYIFTLFAPDMETMNNYEEQLHLIASKNQITVKALNLQQERAFASAVPLANNKVELQRLMTSSSVASMLPFDVKEIRQKNGFYYGLNASSRNMIIYNRTSAINPNGAILGMPGAGKSFSAKREMTYALLKSDDEVYVIDPEREYKVLADEMNGTVVRIANGSNVHINPFDLNIDNADEDGDPIKVKTDFITSICEIAIGGRYGLSPIEASIIGRCVGLVYQPYITYLNRVGKSIDTEHAPTMSDFYNLLLLQPEPEAQKIALALEKYVKGGLDIFSHHTNIDIDNRFVIYDIKDIGAGLKELGLHICLDNIWNKIISNHAKGKRTWFYIDEFYLLMKKPTSASYIAQIWKRARKWNGVPTAITQNVEDLLKSEDARTILNNCSFVMLLGQAPINKAQLSDMFDISPDEQKYISSSKPGMGLLCIENSIIPMDDTFPKDTKLYKIMTSKPDERFM